MKILDNIQRRRGLSAEEFWSDYVLKRVPVILTDAFEGEEVRALADRGELRSRLGDMSVEVRDEYTTAFLRGDGFAKGSRQAVPFREYLDVVDRDPTTKRVVVECPSPELLTRLYRVPAHCHPPLGKQFMFAAGAGNASHLHFDWQPNHNFHFAAHGRKRFILFPPSAAYKLQPVGHVGTVMLAAMPEDEKLAFLQWAGGLDCVLEPGEALFMPMMIWHHVEYIDTSFSFLVRFGQNAAVTSLMDACGLIQPRHIYFQNIAWALTDEKVAVPRWQARLAKLEAALRAVGGRPAFEVWKGYEALLREAAEEMCPEMNATRDFHFRAPVEEFQDRLVQSILARFGGGQ